MRPFATALLLLLWSSSSRAAASSLEPPHLWQERYFWDALLTARDRLARQQSDPEMIPVLKSIANQVAQQVANLQQIDTYVKAQQDNLRYAFGQPDPASSLATIGANFETLSKGADQIRGNLFFLTARCRMATGQALPDPEMYQATLLILGQVQQLQLQLNALYLDATSVRSLTLEPEHNWAVDKSFRNRSEILLKSIVRTQDSVFSVYNAGYELAMRCK